MYDSNAHHRALEAYRSYCQLMFTIHRLNIVSAEVADRCRRYYDGQKITNMPEWFKAAYAKQ